MKIYYNMSTKKLLISFFIKLKNQSKNVHALVESYKMHGQTRDLSHRQPVALHAASSVRCERRDRDLRR